MVTITIIFVVLIFVWIYKSEKKVDVVNAGQRAADISRLQPVRFNFKEKSKFANAVRVWNTLDNNPITIFSYNDQCVFVKYKDGKHFTANLDQMDVLFRFEASTDMRTAIIKLGKNQFLVTEDRDETMTEQEWDKIFDILQCAKVTHQREVLAKAWREEAIRSHKMYKQTRRTMKMVNRL